MMERRGTLTKMRTTPGEPIAYALTLGDDVVAMNELLGLPVEIDHTGGLFCRVCGVRVRSLFGEGYCWTHFETDPGNSPCIVRPELCEAHLGIGRDPAWERAHHDKPHTVYLADSGGVKVGVTTRDNALYRWMDQGARAAVRIAETPYRRLAGEIEVALKSVVSDRTAWQRMLTDRAAPVDLEGERLRILAAVPAGLAAYGLPTEPRVTLVYPMREQPLKVKSVSLERDPQVRARLVGIRGQYLVFGDGRVLNVRRHTGYEVTLRA